MICRFYIFPFRSWLLRIKINSFSAGRCQRQWTLPLKGFIISLPLTSYHILIWMNTAVPLNLLKMICYHIPSKMLIKFLIPNTPLQILICWCWKSIVRSVLLQIVQVFSVSGLNKSEYWILNFQVCVGDVYPLFKVGTFLRRQIFIKSVMITLAIRIWYKDPL